MISTNEFRDLLHKNTVKVVFTKKDGSTREMLATLQEAFIESPTFSSNAEPEYLTTVWDLEKSAWRRVITDAIQSVEVVA